MQCRALGPEGSGAKEARLPTPGPYSKTRGPGAAPVRTHQKKKSPRVNEVVVGEPAGVRCLKLRS